MSDASCITIYKQGLLAKANASQAAKLTGAAIHDARSSSALGNIVSPLPHGADADADAVLGGISAAIYGGFGPSNILATSKEARMAAICQEIAANGFEPIPGIFKMDW